MVVLVKIAASASPALLLSFLLDMASRSLLSILSIVVVTKAAIGPVAQLTVSNAQLAPDGYMREYVMHASSIAPYIALLNIAS